MPYPSNDQLPPSMRARLPAHAQDIFREVFNHAFEEYGGDDGVAFRVAWAAVKRSYDKVDGEWVAKSLRPSLHARA
ncbi:MAG: ChaB family protein [Polyangiales bacterium]